MKEYGREKRKENKQKKHSKASQFAGLRPDSFTAEKSLENSSEKNSKKN